MATWASLVDYVKANYKVDDEQDGMLKLIFQTDETRSQVVLLWRAALMDGAEEWCQIESAFGKADSIDLVKALTEIGEMVVGGAAIINGFCFFRHSVPLADMDPSEFERPFMLVTSTADNLEELLGQGDDL
jgi:hypothetical protein